MQATCHWASSEARDEVCSLSCSGGRFDVRSEREYCHCSGEFKHAAAQCWPASRGVVYEVRSKFVLLRAHCTTYVHDLITIISQSTLIIISLCLACVVKEGWYDHIIFLPHGKEMSPSSYPGNKCNQEISEATISLLASLYMVKGHQSKVA